MLLHLPRMEGHGTAKSIKNGPALAGHGAEAVRYAIAGTIMELPAHLRRSPTWDQGAEMAQHAQLRIDTGLDIYFCDPQGPWQRGSTFEAKPHRRAFPDDRQVQGKTRVGSIGVRVRSHRKALRHQSSEWSNGV
jgi:IS30 family transposase